MSTIENRRNARIRKILENSEQRLSKINGVEQKTTVSELDNLTFNSPSDDHENLNGLRSTLRPAHEPYNYIEQPAFTSTTSHQNSVNAQVHNISKQNGQVITISKPTLNKKLIHIFSLALIQNILLVICDFLQIDSNGIYLGNIFIPLIVYDICYYLVFSKDITSSNFVNVLLNNYLNSNISEYLKYFTCFVQILQDMMIYFFTFIIFYKCFAILK